ncbi:MAG: ABC transporter ATP-binding protein [Deltaproteobacteria bacterium]|nr:ABC transporter ATP-binding protein [Deltaproteobacteria bacterium]
MEPLLTVENLKTYFLTSRGTVKAVDDVSFTINRGQTLGLVGESGSGKSVTALSLLRLVSPPGQIIGGKILMNNSTDLLKLPEEEMRKIRGQKIAMVFQEPMTSLNPVFTIANQIEEAIAIHQKCPSPEGREKMLESLRLVGIPDPIRVAKSYPHELSGGMRQRGMIAMALACQPELLVADEPTTALDVTIQAQVLELLKELQKKLGMALILITHDLGVVAETVETVMVMYAGKIVESAPTREIFANPRHPYTKALLGAIPRWNEGPSRLQVIPGTVPDLSKLPPGCSFQDRCEKVENRCRQEEPELEEKPTGKKGNKVRCHFPWV